MDIVEKPFMNMAIFIIPMKSAWYKVSNKHLNFEIRSSDTWEPPSYTHIQTSMFWILRESYDFSDEFFLINWGISKVFHAKKTRNSQILRSKRTPELLLCRIFAKSKFHNFGDTNFFIKYRLTALMLETILTKEVFF